MTDPERIFNATPGLTLAVAADEQFTILAASDAYLRSTHLERSKLVGRGLFEVFASGTDAFQQRTLSNLRTSLERVIATGRADSMDIQRYDLAPPSGEARERYWKPTNVPVLDSRGRIEVILHAVEDVTERVRAERDFHATEVLESIPEGFFGFDRDWRFTYVNREASLLVSKRPSELLGRVLWEVFPGLAGSAFEEGYRRSMDAGETRTLIDYYPDHQRWYEVKSYPVPNGVAIYFRDVTAQKSAELAHEQSVAESERLKRIYEAALSNTPDLVYVWNLEHRFIYANEALLHMWGRTREEALGKHCIELGYEPWHAAMHDREIDQVVATRQPFRGEVPFTGTEGRRVYDYILVPVFGPTGEVVAVAGTTRDITDRKLAEQAKDEFLATLSHELRNPLAPLRNALGVLRMGDGRVDPKPLHEMMERQVNHLVRLVDDLLELSRISRGTLALRRERVDVATVVRNAVETSQPLIQAAGHRLQLSLPDEALWVHGDAVRLAQVIANLLDNAAKYTQDGGEIGVSAVREGTDVAISVRDNGAGIAPDAIARMFEMFSRGDRSTSRGQGGLGIGLALARKLATLHAGTLDASSEGPGKGSEFTLRVPLLLAEATPAHAEATADPASLGRRRVLVVDDNRDAADSVGLLLGSLGAEVRIAYSGPEAIEAFGRYDPEVVLLDIGMPGMDGYEVARTLRHLHPGHRAGFVALTGWGQEKDRTLAAEAGFDRHLVKPADLESLRALFAPVRAF